MGCSSSTQKESSPNPPQQTTEKAPEEKVPETVQQNPKASVVSSITPNENVGRILKNVPLLSKLSDSERATLGGAVKEKFYSPCERIINQGENGEGFFIIKSGEVSVEKLGDDGIVTQLAKLKAGDFFGETALINNAPRGASVVACPDGSVVCWYLERTEFNALFGQSRLNVQFAKRQAISAEQSNKKAAGNTSAPANAVREKDAESRKIIQQAMQDNVVFANLDQELKLQIINEMYRADIKQGVSAIKQGDFGDNLYVVESGEFNVYVNDKLVATRGAGTCFGELALLYNSPRAATVTASEDSIVWVIDRYTFRRIVTGLSEQKFETYLKFLKNVQLLTPLAEYERRKIAEALEEVSYLPNCAIFRQGDEGDAMYIVYSGEVSIMKAEVNETPKEVMRCKPGDYFGERALLTSEPRAATAVSIATNNNPNSIRLLRLDRSAFALLLGPLEDIMKLRVQSYNEKDDNQEEQESKNLQQRRTIVKERVLPKIDFSSLKVLGTLGKGSFGFVQLVQDKNDGNVYALKAVSKAQIVQTGQQGHVMSEKKAMLLFDHPFLIKLFGTHKDRDRLYFLLEPSLGGELFSVLRERTLFDEETARFYAASVLLGFEYMHSLNIIYRDLKPENLLLDKEGFLKVTDFGFAKDISSGRTWTLCGTPDYLAPEIVAGKGHGKGVDWWTLGIFIYEMLASYPPFYDEDPMKTYAKIMHGAINFPSHFSKEAVSLIKKLLQHKPTKRLGVVKGGAEEIKKHPWFRNFNWDALITRTMKPPIIPKIKSNIDLSNFDDYSNAEMGDVEQYVDDGSNWDAEF